MRGEVLVPGRHAATLREVEDLFVSNAPFSSERSRIFAALSLYIDQVRKVLPNATVLWVNGGFVTHKPWAPPEDVDVVLPVVAASVNALEEQAIKQLFSYFLPNGNKVQPMAGLVDGFVFDQTSPDQHAYWNGLWSRVLDSAKAQVPGAVKGYLEVAI
jgi:hypothetical protein